MNDKKKVTLDDLLPVDGSEAPADPPPMTLGEVTKPAPPKDLTVEEVMNLSPKLPLIMRSIRAGQPEHTWPELAAGGHIFPQLCPEWTHSFFGSPNTANPFIKPDPVLFAICRCGALKMIPGIRPA